MLETAGHIASGKVRELYELDDHRLLLAASDRISVFDVVLPTPIPDKGRVLAGLSAFWFRRTRELLPNHFLALRDDGRSLECRRLEMLPLECVVRGYLAGSAWEAYREHDEVSGRRLPPGLTECERLPHAIFTPSTKAETGHDVTIDMAAASDLVGATLLAEVEETSVRLYGLASAWAEQRGIIIADTKFEFGLDDHGRLVLADEVFTPDSSRFWPADRYEPGHAPPSFDKQYARDFCAALEWDKAYPGPELPPEIVAGTRHRYVEAFERITGVSFEAYLADPRVVLA